jgi:hypothetical protein
MLGGFEGKSVRLSYKPTSSVDNPFRESKKEAPMAAKKKAKKKKKK